MSFALNELNTIRIVDPRVNFSSERSYAVLTGGSQISWKPFQSVSFSNSALNFSCPPPNPGICVDPKVYLSVPVLLQFSGIIPIVGNPPHLTQPSGTLLNNAFDAFRAFPLSNIIQTLTVRLNNSAASINLADTITALLRYNTPHKIKEFDYSLCPTMQDYYQNYQDQLIGGVRNPLTQFGSNSWETTRGAFPYVSVNNPSITDGVTLNNASLQAVITEPLFLSPFLFGKGSCNHNGFIGIQTMDFQFVLGNNLQRIWSHDLTSGVTFSSFNVQIGQPALLFTYITPKLLEPIPRSLSYSYMVVDRYPTDANVSVAPNSAIPISSNNIQLNTIPRRVYIYARQRNADLTMSSTDTFFALNQININYNNVSGLLSSASAMDLYNISKKNGCNLSWPEWSGGVFSNAISIAPPTFNQQGVPVTFAAVVPGSNPATPLPSGAYPTGLVGSVLCLDLGVDIGLDDIHSPGEIMTSQLQVNANFTNINQLQAINPTMYLVVISEGIWTVENMNSISQIGVLSKQDIVEAHKKRGYNYSGLDNIYGGNILNTLKKYGRKIWHGIKVAAPYIKKGIDVASTVAKLAPLVGLGDDVDDYGGVAVGGRRRYKRKARGGMLMSRDELQHRLLR
jgi:hypothetical protein